MQLSLRVERVQRRATTVDLENQDRRNVVQAETINTEIPTIML